MAGGLPIVNGPDDYSVFVPNNHSVIRVSDFAGPKALADYLRRLENVQALCRELRKPKYGEYHLCTSPPLLASCCVCECACVVSCRAIVRTV